MKGTFITVLIFFSMIFLSCGGNGSSEDVKDSLDLDDTGIIIQDETDEIIYFLSSPGEIVDVLNQSDLKYKSGLVNDYSKSSNYLMQASQAINLGIYSSDLAYCSYYEELSQAANLFFSVQDLCRKLEVSYLLNNIVLARVKANLHNPDSIKVLSKEYNKVIYNHFIENDKQNVLILISTGGLVEGLYLALNSIDKIKAESPLSATIAEQKFAFEVLRDFAYQQKDDPLVSLIIPDMKKMDEIFSNIKALKKEKTTVNNTKDGKVVIGGSNNLFIDQAQFNKLKQLISKIRNGYVAM